MTGSTKQKVLILIGLVTLITMIIAASLPQLQLQPGMPIPKLQGDDVVVVPAAREPVMVVPVNQFAVIFFAIIFAGSMLYVVYKVIRGTNWRELLVFLRITVVTSLLVSGAVFMIFLMPKSESSGVGEIPLPAPRPLPTSPLGSAPPSLLWLVGIGLLVASILVAVWITTSYRQARPLDLVELEAEKAWRALKDGLDLKGVIIKCYRQMSLALEKEKGIGRKDYMTTGEFEALLEEIGIPHDPIHQLTRLFNAVRYGNWQPNRADEQTAIQCLESIMMHSREIKGLK